ncbi:A/G-specific adenine glycosylase [Prolixibacteraceae bacterium JC049]|nr:A/G-specific adenine glycosylase [Prolixibacteraceae bacterium JC049]
MEFAQTILNWYNIYKRELPWRGESDPYKIWISEVILQQTRVDQGKSYYYKFVENFPKVSDLANADEDFVMKCWQGLGYYSRARNLQFSAKYITKELNGEFPNSYKKLLELKGVGPYVAAAVASIAFQEKVAAIDGNVYRVLGRIFGIDKAIDTSAGKKYYQQLGNELIKNSNAGDFNQAVMEFGALHCSPKQPKCESCPFSENCIALRDNKIEQLPVKSKKVKQRDRFFHYLLVNSNDEIMIGKRTGKDIWNSLYEFPLVETPQKMEPEAFLSSEYFPEKLKSCNLNWKGVQNMKPHILSHQRIHAQFYEFEIEGELPVFGEYSVIKKKDIANFAFPRLIELYLTNSHKMG